MAVSSVGSYSLTGNSAASGSSGARIADNFNQFLQLLTTQLQNQNPLDPLDTNQFTQQLVQFAGVEQQIQTNDTLTALLATSDATRLSSAVSFIGKQVVAEGRTTLLDESNATWLINSESAAPTSKVIIKNADGEQVYSQNVSLAKGDQMFTWNGMTTDNLPAPNGFYTITVVAQDAAGKAVTTSTDIQGPVTGVELEDGQPVLNVGNIRIKLSDVKNIVNGSTTPPTEDDGDTGDDTDTTPDA
ncbi:flagellar hook assembly protein FlgD [Flaviflagellibacter deserti]|jgi:flagellar basal-body rod modification protein FlgD|uniref:Basal-body rod modification protein FlgD n=1 Tax=Flaviflagellibacter deserti TaxID=2267266 RepID=A0ABV9Z0X8_9HYPH